jgi:hypothetical protein
MRRDHQKPMYHIEEKEGHHYVYYLQYTPVETLFDVTKTREQAEQAIKDHKDGKHPTQAKFG